LVLEPAFNSKEIVLVAFGLAKGNSQTLRRKLMPSHGAVKEAMRKQPAKVLDHLRVREAENGGHIVEHHFTSMEHEPEHHAFGEGEGKAMLAHVGKHMGVESEPGEHDIAAAEGHDKAEIDA
jgi:hypothetical protein